MPQCINRIQSIRFTAFFLKLNVVNTANNTKINSRSFLQPHSVSVALCLSLFGIRTKIITTILLWQILLPQCYPRKFPFCLCHEVLFAMKSSRLLVLLTKAHKLTYASLYYMYRHTYKNTDVCIYHIHAYIHIYAYIFLYTI